MAMPVSVAETRQVFVNALEKLSSEAGSIIQSAAVGNKPNKARADTLGGIAAAIDDGRTALIYLVDDDELVRQLGATIRHLSDDAGSLKVMANSGISYNHAYWDSTFKSPVETVKSAIRALDAA